MLGEVSGATLKRGMYFGRSWSRFQRSRMSLNSNVAVKRPHISGAIQCRICEGSRPLSTPALQTKITNLALRMGNVFSNRRTVRSLESECNEGKNRRVWVDAPSL